MRKWVTRIVLTATSDTNLSLQIVSINDNGQKTAYLKPIRFKNSVIWGDADITWGDALIVWNYQGLIEEQRRFPAQGIRCSYKQIQLTNADVEISTSDVEGLATVNNSLKTATLVNLATMDWPVHSVGYYLSFENDNYVNKFLVTSSTADTLTFADVGNLAPNGNFAWKLTGIPKDQVLNLLSYCLHYSVLGKTQVTYKAGG
jgi:hypothetical protein